jgi:hypothetical protein
MQSRRKDWNLISRTILPIAYQEDVLAPDMTPTAVVLKQTGPWTYGMLANQT